MYQVPGCGDCQKWEVVPCVCGDSAVCILMSWFWLPFPWWGVPALRCCPFLEAEMENGEKGPIYCGAYTAPIRISPSRPAFCVRHKLPDTSSS